MVEGPADGPYADGIPVIPCRNERNMYCSEESAAAALRASEQTRQVSGRVPNSQKTKKKGQTEFVEELRVLVDRAYSMHPIGERKGTVRPLPIPGRVGESPSGSSASN